MFLGVGFGFGFVVVVDVLIHPPRAQLFCSMMSCAGSPDSALLISSFLYFHQTHCLPGSHEDTRAGLFHVTIPPFLTPHSSRRSLRSTHPLPLLLPSPFSLSSSSHFWLSPSPSPSGPASSAPPCPSCTPPHTVRRTLQTPRAE